MTVSAIPTFIRAFGNGSTTVVNFPFKVFDGGDLLVRDITDADLTVVLLVLDVDYQVFASATEEGGNVTLTTPTATGHTLDIRSILPLAQPEDIRNQGRFLPELHEGVFDRLARQNQDTRRFTDSAVRIPDGEDLQANWDTLLSLSNRKGKYLGHFNDTTGELELFSSIGATILTQSLIGSFLDAAFLGSYLYKRTQAEITAAVTPTNYAYPPWDGFATLEYRYGADGTGGVGDTAALVITKRSSILGFQALQNQLTTAGPLNVAIGYQSLRLSTTGGGGLLNAQGNTSVGAQAMATGTVRGDFNVAVGYLSLTNAHDSYCNTAVGLRTLTALTDAQYNTAVGCDAANGLGAGNENTAIGAKAMLMPLGGTADHNTAVGSSTLYNISTGQWNVAVGNNAGLSLTVGLNNVAVGALALNQNITGSDNTAIGFWALRIATGSTNVAVGKNCMGGATTGTENVAVGVDALSNTAGGNTNTAIGRSALAGNISGSSSTAVGKDALLAATGGLNTAVGYFAGRATVGGTQNVFIGRSAGTANTSGSLNTAVGDGAVATASTVSSNTGIGFSALAIATGSTNTAVGAQAGDVETTGSANTFVGYQAGHTQTAGFTNSTSLGNTATCTGSNQITLGNASIATIRAQVTTITAISDARLKKNIAPFDIPDEFLDEVEIVTYEWIASEMPKGQQMGVIAQQLDALQEKYGLQWLGLVDKTDPQRWEATPGKLLFPLILKTQKLARRVTALEAG